MKDLRFTDSETNPEVDITYRVDMLGGSGNLTVSQVIFGQNFSPKDNPSQDEIASKFKQMPYTLDAFKEFAEDNEYQLTIADSNGDNSETLIAIPTPTPTPTV